MAVSQHIWHCGAGLPGDVLIADLRAYRYAPHFHDAWSVGAIAAGRCAFTADDCYGTRPPPVSLAHEHAVRCLRLDAVAAAEGVPA